MNDWMDAEHHVERAHELYDAGRWDEAETELRRALTLNPYQAEWHFNLGLTLEAAGRHVDAATAFERCFQLKSGEDSPDANCAILIAMNLIRADQPESALAWLDKAETLDPSNLAVYVQRVEAYGDLNRPVEAEEAFYIGQQIEPAHAELYASIARVLSTRGDHERSVWCLREAARLDPDLPRVRARLARAFADSGRLERARQLYVRELREDPGDPDTLLDLGELLMDMNRLQEAGEKFRRVLELEPDHPDAHHLLGELAERENKLADALVHYDVVLRLDGTYPGARTRLARVMLQRGREEDLPRVRELLRRGLREATSDTQTAIEEFENLGRLMIGASVPADAIRAYRVLLERKPGNHRAHHGLSVAMLETGNLAEGIDEARRALALQPRFVPAMHNLALAHLRDRRWVRARFWVHQALRIEPEDPAVRRLRLKLRIHAATCAATWLCRTIAKCLRPLNSVFGRPARVS
ncbi:MAG: tetratricopeptide repeat protein [Phycisphaerales bacterium]